MEEVKKYHENGKLWIIGFHEDGKAEGEWKSYHENGKLKEIGSYKDGKQEGESRTYWENGELRSISFWKGGKRIRKPGRPKGTTKPDSRRAYLTIRLTDEEKSLIKQEAEKLGVPIIDVFMMFLKFYKEHQK